MTLEYQKKARKRYVARKQREHGLESFKSIIDEEEEKAKVKGTTWLDNPPMPTTERAKIAKENKLQEKRLGVKRGKDAWKHE
jgi:hypothetical protein